MPQRLREQILAAEVPGKTRPKGHVLLADKRYRGGIMLMTLCKKTAALCALRAAAAATALLCLCITLVFWGAPARAADTVQPSSSSSCSSFAAAAPPQTLPDGGPNLNAAWLRHGGARLYWNTLMQPQQLRMVGAGFADPAAVPELMPSPQGQTGGKAAGKSRAGVKKAPHSVVIAPGAPLLPMRGASRPAVQTGSTAQKTDPAAPRVSEQRPASASPALSAPSSSANGKAANAQPDSAAAGRSANGAASGAKSAVAPTVAPGVIPKAPTAQGASSSAGGVGPNNGHALPGAGKADTTATGNGVSGHADHAGSGAVVPGQAATSAARPASLPGVLSGSGAAAGALNHTEVGAVHNAEGDASQGILLPPPVPSLSADDLLPPSNGSSGPASVRAPLP